MKQKTGILLSALLTASLFFSMPAVRPEQGKTQTVAAVKPENPYRVVIDVQENRIDLLRNGKLYQSYVCATGKSDTPSPLGTFKIVRKSLWGEGFGGYFLGLNCPWGDYGIHGTTSPDSVGTDASHGCFRMYSEDIEQFYQIVPLGTVVYITGGCYGAFGSGMRRISPGMFGEDVLWMQKKLKEQGYFKGVCNGRYDSPGFRTAVHRFQKAHGFTVSDTVSISMQQALGFVQME